MFVPPVAKPKSRACAPRQSTDAAWRGPDVGRTNSQVSAPGAQTSEKQPSWDFGKISLHSRGSGESFPPPPPRLPLRSSVCTKLQIGVANDPLEHEANRAADETTFLPVSDATTGSERRQRGRAQPRLRADARASTSEWETSGPSPDSFQGRGRPLPAPLRGFFEKRFDYSFGNVRVHDGPDAAESARSLGARAYTWGREIVFGSGEYLPRSRYGTRLLAHELAHVVQQDARQDLVQCSPLSDSVKKDWDADHKIETLFARLAQSDVQAAQGDTDIDTMIASGLAHQQDDLWVAQRIRSGELGKSTGALGPKVAGKPVPRSIQAFFFRGTTDRRALVIAGVHGTERQGIEVANDLIRDLQPPAPPPLFTSIIVPSLFPDNAASISRESGSTPTNRNFPPASEDLAAATAAGGGKAVDASKSGGGKRTRQILLENQLLLQLIEKFQPERILSIHGTWGPGSAGVFYDTRSLRPDELKAARDWARATAYMRIPPDQQEGMDGQERLQALEDSLYQQRVAQLSGQANTTDRDLSLKAAQQIDTDTASIAGRGSRDMGREGESAPVKAANKAARRAHPSIAGNVGPKGKIDNAQWSGGVPGGVSLGSYAPPRGISVFTIEPPLNSNTDDYAKIKGDVSQVDRKAELKAYADAVRTILLGT